GRNRRRAGFSTCWRARRTFLISPRSTPMLATPSGRCGRVSSGSSARWGSIASGDASFLGKGSFTMKRISLAVLLTAAGIGDASAANDLIWVFDHDEAAGYAGVIAAADKNSEEPHYSILITCSQEDEWAMYISDLDVKALGDTIAKNEQPTFTISSTKTGKTETSEPYYPDISYNQEEAR